MTPQQKEKFNDQQNIILEKKYVFKTLIDKLTSNKRQFMQELQALEATTDKLRDILTPEQQAKYLIFVEKVINILLLIAYS